MKLFGALVGVVLLLGCSSAPVTRYYVLSPVVASGTDQALPLTNVALTIREIRLPQYLERPQIVTRGGDHQIQLADDAQWAGNLQQDMTRVLTENLAALLKSDRIFSAPHNGPLKPDFRLDLEVLRFEQDPERRVALSVRWWLIRVSDNTLLEAPSTTLYGPAQDSRSYEALVASMSTVYGDLARLIARSVRSYAKVAQ
ncbi:MAG: membrane integrity-associated transporter subunit PqiC [Rhodocyclaceae bacterium]|nr:membrane integrity-associated transporter subunit PqiC [Rhodocyclaceae bacterium]